MDKKEIKRFVLDNAVNYDGKANSFQEIKYGKGLIFTGCMD